VLVAAKVGATLDSVNRIDAATIAMPRPAVSAEVAVEADADLGSWCETRVLTGWREGAGFDG
jgi:hypothetical protein